MNAKQAMIVMQQQQDQQESEAKEWWEKASLDQKHRVWKCINRTYANPAMQLMSALAMIEFRRLALGFTTR